MRMRFKVSGTLFGAAFIMALVAGCESGDGNGSAGSEASVPSTVSSATSAPEESGAARESGTPGDGSASGEESGTGTAGDGSAEQVGETIEQAMMDGPIRFQPQSAEFAPGSRETLEKIANALQGNEVTIKVTTSAGYADVNEALTLSEQRAETIKSALEGFGVEADRIEADPTGNENAEGADALDTEITVA